MPTGHEAFGKAKEPNTEGNVQMAAGGAYAAHSVASAPLLKTGRKKPTQMVKASPKRQPGRYQGELTQAMREGKVPKESTLRVLKTPSGRFINAGGTHRHVAREAMGEPTRKISVAHLAFEPHENAYARIGQRASIARLKRGSKAALAGKNKPVSEGVRDTNKVWAHAADTNDEAAWKGFKEGRGREMASAARKMHKVNLASAAVGTGIGLGVAGIGAAAHHTEKKRLEKVGKAVNGHDAFEISKRDRDTSVGRTLAGAVFPGFHGAIAGKKGHKLKAVGYELGGNFLAATPGAAVGTHIASKNKHYKKLSKAMGSTDVAATTKGKKVSVAYPPEVNAYIAAKKGELSKSVTGHEAFLLEDVEKAFGLPAVANAGKAAMGAGKSILKPGGGAHVGVGAVKAKVGAMPGAGKVGGFLRANPKKSIGAGAAVGGFGLGRMGKN